MLTDLCCGLILMALPGGGPGPEGWEKLFTQHYATLQTAIARRDTRTLGAMLTPDFVAFDINGVATDAQQMLAEVIAQPDDPGRVVTTRLLSVTIKELNNSARVVHRDTMQAQERGADGKLHLVSTSVIITDDWVRNYSVWQLRHRETAVFDQAVDGVPLVRRLRGDPDAPPVPPMKAPSAVTAPETVPYPVPPQPATGRP
ncbi:MAG: nuclear transport factor 2 family protein [Alphaproteobacteria bacterium]